MFHSLYYVTRFHHRRVWVDIAGNGWKSRADAIRSSRRELHHDPSHFRAMHRLVMWAVHHHHIIRQGTIHHMVWVTIPDHVVFATRQQATLHVLRALGLWHA